MNINDYQDVYAIVEVKEEGKIYGYVACEAYLLAEIIDTNGDKRYKIVLKKDIKDLTLDTYENVSEQKPIFNKEKECINAVEVNKVYSAYDIAKDASYEENINHFKKLANAAIIRPENYGGKISNLYDLKRAVEEEKIKLEERFIDLNIIEKFINGESKRF